MQSEDKKRIDEANNNLEIYWEEKGKEYLKTHRIPSIKSVVYNRIFYPIVYENEFFYWLGGSNLFMVLKSKCVLTTAEKTQYYEVVASKNDVFLGKSPIIPAGCPKDNRGKIYPDDISSFEINFRPQTQTHLSPTDDHL